MNYENFLLSKVKRATVSGFEIDERKLNTHMFPFQKYIIKRALKQGKYALFSDCGTGKSIMQLEWANQVAIHAGKPVLILTPFAGIGSEVYEAVRLNRKGIGFELKESYFNNMTNNLRGLLEQKNQMDIMELCR